MAQLSFEIPDEDLERVSRAFCGMRGHAPCQDPNCLLETITNIVVRRVTEYEKTVATRNAVANVLPLTIAPQVT